MWIDAYDGTSQHIKQRVKLETCTDCSQDGEKPVHLIFIFQSVVYILIKICYVQFSGPGSRPTVDWQPGKLTGGAKIQTRWKTIVLLTA